MNTATLRRVEQVEPRAVLLVAGGVLVLLLLASWFYVLKPVLGEYRSLDARRLQAELEAQPSGLAVDGSALDGMAERIASLESTLAGAADNADETLPELMSVLADLALRHEVTLVGVKPAAPVRALGFEEQPFDVDAHGRYFDVVTWLHAAQTRLQPMQVRRFELREGTQAGTVSLRLQVSDWRTAEQP